MQFSYTNTKAQGQTHENATTKSFCKSPEERYLLPFFQSIVWLMIDCFWLFVDWLIDCLIRLVINKSIYIRWPWSLISSTSWSLHYCLSEWFGVALWKLLWWLISSMSRRKRTNKQISTTPRPTHQPIHQPISLFSTTEAHISNNRPIDSTLPRPNTRAHTKNLADPIQ